MFTAAKNYIMRFLDPNIDFRVRLFNVLAIAGTAISTVAFTINIITSMTVSALPSRAASIGSCMERAVGERRI